MLIKLNFKLKLAFKYIVLNQLYIIFWIIYLVTPDPSFVFAFEVYRF